MEWCALREGTDMPLGVAIRICYGLCFEGVGGIFEWELVAIRTGVIRDLPAGRQVRDWCVDSRGGERDANEAIREARLTARAPEGGSPPNDWRAGPPKSRRASTAVRVVVERRHGLVTIVSYSTSGYPGECV